MTVEDNSLKDAAVNALARLIATKNVTLSFQEKDILRQLIKDIDTELMQLNKLFSGRQLDVIANIEQRIKLLCLILNK